MKTDFSRRDVLAAIAGTAVLRRVGMAADGISVGMIPDAGATQVSIDQKAPLRDYLAKALGEPVKLIIPPITTPPSRRWETIRSISPTSGR